MTIKAYSDASFKNNMAGIGVLITNDNNIIFKHCYATSCDNSFQAELLALNRIFMYLIRGQESNKIEPNNRIVIFSDCKELVSNMCKKRLNESHLNNCVLIQCRKYKETLSKNNTVALSWIPRSKNKVADRLSKKGIYHLPTSG